MDHSHLDTDDSSTGLVTCPICDRQVDADYTTKHHLVPKSRKGRETILLCTDCHKQVHVLFSPKELERKHPTIELLKADERMQKWIDWISKRTSASRLKGSMKYR